MKCVFWRGVRVAGLSRPATPGKGVQEGCSGCWGLCASAVFTAFQESSGDPYAHLHAATCSRASGLQRLVSAGGNSKRGGGACLLQGAAPALNLGPRLRLQEGGREMAGTRHLESC